MSESQPTIGVTTPAAVTAPTSGGDARFWYLWQALTMPLFYPSFGLACVLLLLLTGYGQLRLRDAAARTLWLRRQVQKIARTWLGWGSKLKLLRHDIDLRDSLTDCAPARVIVANHPSLVDVIFVLAELPQVCCVLKAELGRVPVLGMLIRKLDYLSNDDPERLLEEGTARLAAGESLLIFPEGTRTKKSPGLRFRLGATELALRAGVPVLPIIIHYHGRYLSGLGRWYDFPEQQLHYTLEIGPQQATPISTSAAQRRRLRRRCNAALEQHITDRLAQGPRDQHTTRAAAHWNRST